MKFTDILTLLSGLTIFLYGMEVMGNGFKHFAGGKLQDTLEKLTKKPFVAMMAGLLVTALVQSSSATTSMLVSFVNAGIMKVAQTVYVILGSNIGTTITGHLMALDVGLVAPIMAFIGVCLIMFIKNDILNAIGEIMMGLGFVFIGMEMMSGGLAPLGQSEFFLKILSNMRNPIFGILVGMIVTAVVQSSSASLGIIQSLAKSGLVGIKDVMFFNLGQNIGTCTTALLASLSFNRDAKRVSIINITFNMINAILFTVLYLIFPFDQFYQSLAPDNVVQQIAMMHTFTNVVTSLVCFPIANYLAKIAYLIIPDQGSEKKLQPEITNAYSIEENAAFNIYGINIELDNMFSLVRENIEKSIDAILEHYSALELVNKNEDEVNIIHDGIARNLKLLMASDINMHESKQAASLFSINVDLERMSDHSLNIAEASEDLVKSDLSFSLEAYDEIKELSDILLESLNITKKIIDTGEVYYYSQIRENEEKLNRLCSDYRTIEINRMKNKEDDSESGVIYSELLIDIERLGDHLINVAEAACVDYTD